MQKLVFYKLFLLKGIKNLKILNLRGCSVDFVRFYYRSQRDSDYFWCLAFGCIPSVRLYGAF